MGEAGIPIQWWANQRSRFKYIDDLYVVSQEVLDEK